MTNDVRENDILHIIIVISTPASSQQPVPHKQLFCQGKHFPGNFENNINWSCKVLYRQHGSEEDFYNINSHCRNSTSLFRTRQAKSEARKGVWWFLMLKFRKKVWLLWRKWSWCCWNISSREEEMLTIPTLILTSDTNRASLRGGGGGGGGGGREGGGTIKLQTITENRQTRQRRLAGDGWCSSALTTEGLRRVQRIFWNTTLSVSKLKQQLHI